MFIPRERKVGLTSNPAVNSSLSLVKKYLKRRRDPGGPFLERVPKIGLARPIGVPVRGPMKVPWFVIFKKNSFRKCLKGLENALKVPL